MNELRKYGEIGLVVEISSTRVHRCNCHSRAAQQHLIAYIEVWASPLGQLSASSSAPAPSQALIPSATPATLPALAWPPRPRRAPLRSGPWSTATSATATRCGQPSIRRQRG